MRLGQISLWRLMNVGAAVLASLFWAAQSFANDNSRVLTIGGSVTEIVYALGQEHRLVARDTTSTFPAPANSLPDVGYMRALSPEGVLSVAPELIISDEGAGPPEVLDVLKAAGIPFVKVPDTYNTEGIIEKILIVGSALGVDAEAGKLAETVEAKLAAASAAAQSNVGEPKRVMFILSMANGRIMASGTNTAADGIIKLAGGVNAVNTFEGYKPLTDEAISIAAPDVILMMDRQDHSSSADALFALPSMATTPAAKARALVKIDGLLLLGFGPRTPIAIERLATALYGETG